MAGFFSLGGGSGSGSGRGKGVQEREERGENNNNSGGITNQFLFRNEEIYNKGFEIWPQSHSYHQHHQQNLNNLYSFGIGGSSTRKNNNNNNNEVNDDVSVSFSDESNRFGFTMMRPSGSGSGSVGGMNCQDCGNQAKKDCPHLRCRTCCKSRGFQCQTHVKSTWVPAAKRRERQQQLSALQQQQQQQQPQLHSSRRQHRENQTTTTTLVASATGPGGTGTLTCSPVPITTTGLELGQFPAELNSEAIFRCVKVSAMDAQDERFAYQTAVNIGGHVFKGILYDQGVEDSYNTAPTGEGSSGGGNETQPQNLLTASTTSGVNNPFEYSSLYPAPLNAFMAGTQFFPPPRS